MKIRRYMGVALVLIGLTWYFGARQSWAGDRAALAATDPLANFNRLPAPLEQTVGSLRVQLEAKGFAVARGYWTLWGVEDCKYPMQTVGYCFGNNPTAPYVLAVLPTWNDEYVDQSFHHMLNEPLRNMSAIYRLDPREALIVVAQLPPPARYLGIGSNVFTREIPFNQNDMILSRVTDPLLQNILYGTSPDPSRMMMIASIGNSINNVMIENQAGHTPWNKPAYFVITSDSDLQAVMADALVQAGASRADIFTEPVASGLVNLGLDRKADDLITYIRYAMPDDPIAGDQWRRQLPLTVLRVRDMSSRQYNNPLPVPAYTPHTATFDQTTKPVTDDFASLQNAVRAYWGQTNAPLITFFSAYKFLDLIGQHCLGYPDDTRGPMDCLGDSQDDDFQISGSGKLDNNQVIAVIGTLATETGNATYTSLSVNWFPELVGIANIDDTSLKGSADPFASALQNNSASMFYVFYVARDCTGLAHCREISTKLVPNGALVKFIQRNYINPGSTTGPDPYKMLNPVAIVFNGENRP